MYKIPIIVFFCISTLVFSQHKKAYTIFTSSGEETVYSDLLENISTADIVLFGEQHNSAICHWLQYELTSDLTKSRNIILGAEMFERDNQEVLKMYLAGEIDQKGLDTLARLWINYRTDYKPLVEIAKKEKIKFIATNIPRRFANLVFRNGFQILDTLSAEEKSWIAPLPIAFDPEIPTYKNILTMMGEHGTPELVMAQAIKDATMAHFILENYEEGNLFLHYNGAYHSDYYEGILWYLKREKPKLNYKTISTVTQNQLEKLDEEHLGKADFIIVVDENVTTTY